MPHGTIKRLIRDRRLGLIRPEEAGFGTAYLPFRAEDIKSIGMGDLRVGQLVEYDLVLDEARGTPKACNVRTQLPMKA